MNTRIPSCSRRTFLKTSALAAAGAALTARSWAQVAGANGDIRVAVVGLNGRGKSHIASLRSLPGARLVALCDADSAVLRRAAESVGGGVKTYGDIRQLLASSEIDAITIAMPNHWHSLAAIWACQAGKDVYVEKPVSHTVWEGRQLVAAAAKYNRIVQAGTQIRSGEGLREAVEWVRAGNIGKINASRGFCYKFRGSIGLTTGPQPVPETVDYDLWCGPAPLAPLRRKHLHYDWHWQWPTGDGDVGNQGIHQMDVARWFLGEPGLPRHTMSVGGRLGYVDDGDTPNSQIVIHDYPTAPLIFEVRGLPAKPAAASGGAPDSGSAEAAGARASLMDKYRGVSIGNIVDCEGGSVVTAAYFSATAYDRDGKVLREFQGVDRHMANFLDAVRSRKAAELYAPVEEGHVSSALCHLGNISHRAGSAEPPGQIRERVQGNPGLAEAYGRLVEHLGSNGIDLQKTPETFGLPLHVDTANERLLGSPEASRLLSREYREPFRVPDLSA
jgi:predicted dehydrogenase